MKTPTSIGMNRTGIAMSPIDSKRLRKGAEEGSPPPDTSGDVVRAERLMWSASAEPVGTMPPPASAKGVVKTGIEMVKGHHPAVFLDKLGERAAYERSGTRLYEALLVKFDAADPHPGGPTREDLERIRDEELEHYALCRDALLSLGADPTVMTPCADISGVIGMGLVQVMTDPRTTLTQCLEATLVAELTDNDAWMMLAQLADDLGHEQLAADFRRAYDDEAEHLLLVRRWLTNAVRGQAGVDPGADVTGDGNGKADAPRA